MDRNDLFSKEWYLVDNINAVDSPALLIYPDRVIRNIRLLISMIDDVSRLRPHVKTHKAKEAALLSMEAGINKFKCATIAEAEMLAMINARDVLLAYQPAGPKLERFLSLVTNYPATAFSCLVDNYNSAKSIAKYALNNNLTINVYVDLNVGMNRTGIAPGSAAVELYKNCTDLEGIAPRGLHVYDGHIHMEDFEQRVAECNNAFKSAEETQTELLGLNFPKPIIIAGGSVTFPIHAKRADIECSPGTFIYWDAGYQRVCAEQPFMPAAVVVSRIISLPENNMICLDLGHKSIASENELTKRVVFLNAPDLTFLGHSEEHLVAQVPEGHSYNVGDVLYGLPVHICPTVSLYERAALVHNYIADGEWKIVARDRKIKI